MIEVQVSSVLPHASGSAGGKGTLPKRPSWFLPAVLLGRRRRSCGLSRKWSAVMIEYAAPAVSVRGGIGHEIQLLAEVHDLIFWEGLL